MPRRTLPTHDHALTLRPGARAHIPFQFSEGGIGVELAAADPARGRIELLLDNLWGPYGMRHLAEGPEGRKWTELWPANDGRVHAELDLGAGERVYIHSEGHQTHSLGLIKGEWQGDAVDLTFQETA